MFRFLDSLVSYWIDVVVTCVGDAAVEAMFLSQIRLEHFNQHLIATRSKAPVFCLHLLSNIQENADTQNEYKATSTCSVFICEILSQPFKIGVSFLLLELFSKDEILVDVQSLIF